MKDNEKTITNVLLGQCKSTAAVLTLRSTSLAPHRERFEPVVAMASLGHSRFDHSLLLIAEIVDWKGLVPEAVWHARRIGTLKTLVGNRPDMQQGADLNEHEAHIVLSIQQSLLN